MSGASYAGLERISSLLENLYSNIEHGDINDCKYAYQRSQH